MSYSGQKITPKAVKSLNELKPGDHIRVPSSKEKGRSSSGFTSSSTSFGSNITSYSSQPYSASGSSSNSSRPELCNGKVYTHHLLVVEPINDMQVHVIHKVNDEISIKEEIKCYEPKDVTVLEYHSSYTGQEAIKRARQIMREGKEYRLVSNNCEHFVTEVRTGEKQSAQIEGAVVGAVGGGVVGTAAGVGGGAGVGAFIGAGIGSIVPVAGTAIGAFVGGLIGGATGGAIGGGGGSIAGGVAGIKNANK